MGDGEPLLMVDELAVHFASRVGLLSRRVVKAVDGVSFALAHSETLALVGESGSGKTTLGRATLMLVKPTAGRVYFRGEEMTSRREEELRVFRREAQMVFQDPYSSINPFMDVYHIVEEPLVIYSISGRGERVFKTLERVRLTPAEEFATKYPHQLSGGQRQRVALARALILNPSYIVADEPVSMIDASSRVEILDLLKSLQKEGGISFLYITHDIATARYFADRIAVMYLGRIVEMGLAPDVINDPLHPYTKALIESVPEPDPRNRFIERPTLIGEPPNPSNIPAGCRFHPRCPYSFERCRGVDPMLRRIKDRRYVACHLY
ncbi:MAG: ABC transporter ATP-binding protein [Nitrososphaerota archaeon]